jgi:amino acid transporter
MAEGSTRGNLGTFTGVFTPSVLTILGIILFLRIAYVVGSAGILIALVIIVAANAISVLTSVSVSGIATNLRVKGGGDYYLISRTLGPEFGGAIGLVLFLAQSISIGFYCIGFAEAAAALAGSENPILIRTIAIAAVSLLFFFAWQGTDWASRFQYLVMALIIAALGSVAFGVFDKWDPELLQSNLYAPAGGPSFWIIFAVFFPAVTGFTQGVSMSGDLKDPSKSIPRGTFSAVALSFLIYVAVAIALGAVLPGETLRSENSALKLAAAWGPLIDAGVFAATLSSALASFLGAPRILQSLAKDRIFPALQLFSTGSGETENPRRAVILSGVIAVLIIGIGELNLIASIVSMFFLLSYGLLNYATYYEARSKSPSFRPTFAFYSSRLSLLGGLACLGAMLAIDATSAVVAIVVIVGVFQYVRAQDVPARWADSRRSHYLQQVRDNLLAAAAETEHPRDWRPQLLAFSDDPSRRDQILKFASWIEGGSGITTVVKVIKSELDDVVQARSEALEELRKELSTREHTVFPLVISTNNIDNAIAATIQAAGIGPIRGNTVIANWRKGMPAYMSGLGDRRYSQNLRTAFRLGCNLLVLDANSTEWDALNEIPTKKRRIDIWWTYNKTGDLMLLLAHLMTRSEAWEGATIRVLISAGGENAKERFEEMKAEIGEVRIEAEIISVGDANNNTVCAKSRDASVVFLPFTIRGGRFYHPFGGEVGELIDRLPITLLTLASQDVALDADPDEGEAGKIAAATDALSDSAREIDRIRKEIKKTKLRLIGLEKSISEKKADPNTEEQTYRKLEDEHAENKAQLSELVSLLAPQRSKMLEAEKCLVELGITPDEEETAESENKKES